MLRQLKITCSEELWAECVALGTMVQALLLRYTTKLCSYNGTSVPTVQ